MLSEFNVDWVNALNTIPVLFEVGEDYYTFIFHELDNVGCFGEFWIYMGFDQEWNVSICSDSDMAMIRSTSVKPQGTGMSSSSGAIGSRPPDQG